MGSKSLGEILYDMLSQTFGNDLFDGVKDILLINPNSGAAYGAWEVVTAFAGIMKGLGAAFLVIYFLMGIMEQVANDASPRHYLGLATKYLCALYFVRNGDTLIQDFLQIGSELTNALSSSVTSTAFGSDTTQKIWKVVTNTDSPGDLGFMEAIGYILYFVIPFICSLGLGLVLKAMAYSRLFTITLYASFFPFAVADFFSQGIQGAGWRYIRNMLAVCIQGAIMLAIVVIASKIMQGYMSTILTDSGFSYLPFICTYFAVMGCCVMILGKSQQIAKEVLGVG